MITSALDADFGFSDEQLLAADREICAAMTARSSDGLDVLGFGENGVAIAYPTGAPRAVLKRTMGCKTKATAQLRSDQIAAYVRVVEPFVSVAPTELRIIHNADGRFVPFMIQHLFAKDQLVETMLTHESPSATHEIVIALRNAVVGTSHDGNQALDAQFSNFAWVDDQLHYFDVGLPFVYEDGEYAVEVGDALIVMPAILRPFAEKVVRSTLVEMGGVRGSFIQAAMGLPLVGRTSWSSPARGVGSITSSSPP